MFKVLLIKPPNPKSIDLFDSEGLSPPLGLAYLAAILQKKHQVQILDADVEGLDTHGVIQKIKKINPDIVGLTAVTPNFCEAVKIARLARKLKKPPVIILGGPHVSAVPKAVKIGCFNFAVLGEGEETLTELIEGIKAGKTNLENIKGLAFLKKQKLIITPPRPYLKNLDSLPFPAWDLLPPATNYHPTPGMYQNSPMMTVMTSRGCPFKCTFCDRAVFGNTYRARSPKNVVDEMETLFRVFRVKEIKIYDDTFNLDPKRVIGICQEIKRRQLKFTWSCLCRVNFIEKEMLSFMKKAGCWQISLGIESGNNEVLKAVCKSETTEMIEKAVNLIHEAGIETRGFFILGLPCETEKSLEETIDFAKSLKLEMANFYHLIPFPGTEIYKKARKFGHFKKGGSTKEYLPHSNSALPFVPYGLTNAKMRQYFKKAYHDFYFRPSYLTKRILGIRSFSQVRKYAKAMWAILKI